MTKVEHLGGGWYSGAGRIAVDYLGGASFPVTFGRIFINADRDAGAGRIDFVTRGVGAMAEEQLARQEKRKGEKEAEDLAVNDNGNEGKDIIFKGIVDSVFVDEKGEIIIIDTEGERFVYGQPVDPATDVVLPVSIVDGGGNGYVVDGEGKVTGGSILSGNVPDINSLTGFDLVVREVLDSIGTMYLIKQDSLDDLYDDLNKDYELQLEKMATDSNLPSLIKGLKVFFGGTSRHIIFGDILKLEEKLVLVELEMDVNNMKRDKVNVYKSEPDFSNLIRDLKYKNIFDPDLREEIFDYIQKLLNDE